MNYVVVVPTLNAAAEWPQFSSALLANVAANRVLVVDSESTDGTTTLAENAGFRVHSIKREEFNHGGTRQLAVELSPEAEIVVFLTQDAVLGDAHSICNLLALFEKDDIGAAFGRQIPHLHARPIEAHARLFNYPTAIKYQNAGRQRSIGFQIHLYIQLVLRLPSTGSQRRWRFPSRCDFWRGHGDGGKLLLSGGRLVMLLKRPFITRTVTN